MPDRSDGAFVDINPIRHVAVKYGRVSSKELSMWVNDEISGFRVIPDDKPAEVTLSSIALLVPNDT